MSFDKEWVRAQCRGTRGCVRFLDRFARGLYTPFCNFTYFSFVFNSSILFTLATRNHGAFPALACLVVALMVACAMGFGVHLQVAVNFMSDIGACRAASWSWYCSFRGATAVL